MADMAAGKAVAYRTGHQIADTVADSLTNIPDGDYAIGYGILRGMAEKLRSHEHWFLLDNGYFNPGHFNGYYRISYKGTQARFNELRAPWNGDLAPMNFVGRSVMICPPTKPVCEFFSINLMEWLEWATLECLQNGYSCFTRSKGESSPIDWDDVKAVVTFNSSVGWQALQRGIPVLSDPDHSTVGGFYGTSSLKILMNLLQDSCDNRLELLQCMAAHQFTLSEIKQGKAWPLIQHYLSISAMMIGKKLPPMSAPTPSVPVLKRRFQSNI